MTTPSAGTIIAGRYRLTEQLGQGGMGSVWKAEHLTLHSSVAVKLIDPEIGTKPDMLERFQREAQASAALRSPHVVQVIDYGSDEGTPFIAMELLDGETLAARLLRLGRLSNAETTRVVTHVARALGRAHEAGIVHRDLKPDNVFLVPNDEHEIAKVLDFGVAKHSKLGSASGPTKTGLILGTPAYMSPEQAQGIKTVDARSDLWALGVIAYECLVGRVPFESEALGDLLIKICVQPIPVPSERGRVPPGFDAWFARACCRDPEQRFQTAKELADALRQLIERSGSTADGLSLPPSGNGVSNPMIPTAALMPGEGAGAASVAPGSGSGDPSVPPVVASGPVASSHPHGATVPGMSIALQLSPRRPSLPLLATVAAVMLAAGALGAWLVVARLKSPEPAAAVMPPAGAEPAALSLGGSPGVPQTPPAAVSLESPAPAEPTNTPVASPVAVAPATASPKAAATAKAHAASTKPLPPPPAPPPAALPPKPRGAGDQRLGF